MRKLSSRDKGSKSGVFIRVPKRLAKDFPSLGDHDNSEPHITALFVGFVPEKQEILFNEVVKRVAIEHEPFEVVFDDKVSYFTPSKHSDGCRVAKLSIISDELIKLHKSLKKALKDAQIKIDDHFPSYKPHITLEYVEPPKKEYESNVPTGSFLVKEIEIWDGDNKSVFPLGQSKKSGISQLDILHRYSAVAEMTQSGIGVGTGVRLYFRKSVPQAAGLNNAELNEFIASLFTQSEPVHRFKLRSGEIAEIRKGQSLYFVSVIRSGDGSGVRFDIIAIQPVMKEVSEDIKKQRMSPNWGV